MDIYGATWWFPSSSASALIPDVISTAPSGACYRKLYSGGWRWLRLLWNISEKKSFQPEGKMKMENALRGFSTGVTTISRMPNLKKMEAL